MVITIMQPAYLPWLGYFDRIAQSDIFIELDHVQIERNTKTSFTYRNKIRTNNGWCWLSIPLKRTGSEIINSIEIDNSKKWMRKHWMSIVNNYNRSPYFCDYKDEMEFLYNVQSENLIEILDKFFDFFIEKFQIKTKRIKSSSLGIGSKKNQLVVDLCKAVGATTYLSGPFGRDYLDLELFNKDNIDVKWHDFEHPVYPQTYEGFEPYMSALDLLFNVGDSSMDYLIGNKGQR